VDKRKNWIKEKKIDKKKKIGNKKTLGSINFSLKIVPFMKNCGKLWYRRTGNRWQYNFAHALFMLNTYGNR
jgi:hypothetical protein